MNRICLALCGCLLFLGGCMHTTKTQFTQHFALASAAPVSHASDHATRAGEQILQIARIAVPPWLAGNAMYYRLNYRHDNRLAAYGHSDWIAPPATQLEPLVQNAVSAGGGWKAVIGPGTPATADASLHLQLSDFSQAFSQANRSAGVIDATATLINDHEGRVAAQKHFHVKVAATSADAQGGAKALAKASRKLAARLQRWLETHATGVAQSSTPDG